MPPEPRRKFSKDFTIGDVWMAELEKGMRIDGRKPDELRRVEWLANPAPAASGSVTIKIGNTHVICAVTVEDRVPRWMHVQNVPGGWLTAEYRMLPYANSSRGTRESSIGRIGGRTHEIQRLIGRAMRAVVDLQALGKRTIWIDCDVIQADGGTRTASITGAYCALRVAVDRLLRSKALEKDPISEPLSAVSVGIRGGTALLDLNYEEDSTADVDMNVVMTASGKFIELQGTAEEVPFSEEQMQEMMALARKGIASLLDTQKTIIADLERA
jgi:ribonuclease PH